MHQEPNQLARSTQQEPTHGSAVHITPREADVLRRIVRGLSNKQIAGELGISAHTVRDHVCSLLRKFSSGSRTHLAVTFSMIRR